MEIHFPLNKIILKGVRFSANLRRLFEAAHEWKIIPLNKIISL
jgi:hypothetical protein